MTNCLDLNLGGIIRKVLWTLTSFLMGKVAKIYGSKMDIGDTGQNLLTMKNENIRFRLKYLDGKF